MSVDADDVQQRWRGVAKHFPLWRFLIDLFFDWGSFRMIGSDITSMVMQNKNVRRAAVAMEEVHPKKRWPRLAASPRSTKRARTTSFARFF